MITTYIKETIDIEESLFHTNFRNSYVDTHHWLKIDDKSYEITGNIYTSYLQLRVKPIILLDFTNWEYNTVTKLLTPLSTTNDVIFYYLSRDNAHKIETPKEVFLNLIQKYKRNTT